MGCNHKVPRRQTPKPHFSCKSVFVLLLLMLLMQETIMLLSVCNRIAQLDKFLQKDSNAKNASLSSRQFMCKAFLYSSTYPLLFYHYIPSSSFWCIRFHTNRSISIYWGRKLVHTVNSPRKILLCNSRYFNLRIKVPILCYEGTVFDRFQALKEKGSYPESGLSSH